MSKERLFIFDTTLRDGAQTQGVDFSLEDKEKIASALDNLGVDYIEAGWPGANPTDTEFFQKKHNFKNSIIVLTSNLGSQSINDLSVRKEDANEIKKVVDSELKKFFKPEFLNRLDEIVIFNNLELNDLKEIAKIQLQNLEKRLNKKNLKFKITDEAINQLVENSFDNAYGARPLKRIIQKQIETKISNNILNNHYLNKDEINVYLVNGEIIVD